MKDFVHDDQQVVWCPFGIALNNILHDFVKFNYDVMVEELLQGNLTGCDHSSDDLDCKSVKFSMTNAEVLKQNRNEIQFF